MAKYEQSMEGMLDVFLFETNELLEKLDEILIRTESDTLGEEDVGEIFRIMHTVKGSAAMMGLHNVSKLAHSLEDLFSIIREDPNVQFDKPALYELLYAGSDGMKSEIENLSDESVPLTDFTEQIAKNRAFAAAMKGEAPERGRSRRRIHGRGRRGRAGFPRDVSVKLPNALYPRDGAAETSESGVRACKHHTRRPRRRQRGRRNIGKGACYKSKGGFARSSARKAEKRHKRRKRRADTASG